MIIPIASGKGGTGKSVFSLNLAIALAYRKKKVILIDLDLGGSNLHTLLAMDNQTRGLGDFIYRKEKSIRELIIETEISGLFFLSGNTLFPAAANLRYQKKRQIINGIKKLVADFIILDIGAGSSYNTVDFFLTATPGLLLITPEPTAVLDVYYFLKTTLFRLMYLSFPPNSDERIHLMDYIRLNNEKKGTPFKNIFKAIMQQKEEAGKNIQKAVNHFSSRIVVNACRNKNEGQIGIKLRDTILNYLGIQVEYTGFIPYDSAVHQSIIKRMPVLITNPGSPFSQSVKTIAARLAETTQTTKLDLYQSDEELEEMIHEMDKMGTRK